MPRRGDNGNRVVPINKAAPLPYKGNHARTTKYTLLTYLPKALFEQYRRVANIFFTLMAAISLTPFSPLRPWTTWTPLVLVVGVSMLKEAREDYKRYCQDKEVNERPTRVMDNDTGEFVVRPWREVRVGDVVQVLRDEFLPADLMLLATSTEEGTCYVETMNLDGETNLKIKAAPDETRGLSPKELPVLQATIECEGPNSRLYQFTGNLKLAPPLPPAVCTVVNAARMMARLSMASTMNRNATARGGGGAGGGDGGDAGEGSLPQLMLSLPPSMLMQQPQQPATQSLMMSLRPGPPTTQSLMMSLRPGPPPGQSLMMSLRPGPPPGQSLMMSMQSIQRRQRGSSDTGDAQGQGQGGVGSDDGAPLNDVEKLDGDEAGWRNACKSFAKEGTLRGSVGGGGRTQSMIGRFLSKTQTKADMPKEFVVPIGPSAVVLRGCSLRNTDCIYGAVVYAGHDTKIFMNSTEPPSKRSYIEHTVDKVILCVFVVLFSWCITSAVYHSEWTTHHLRAHWYMRPDAQDADSNPDDAAQTGAVSFLVALLLYSYLIPISLYVSIEMVKMFQAMVLIAEDRDMYDAASNTPALARTSNLNEELGMVSSVMTDKTGTLTRNVMEFFKCSISGVAYGAGITEIEKANALRKGIVLDDREDPTAARYRERYFNFYDKRIMDAAWTHEADPATIEMFFRLLAVCHTVIPDGPTTEADIKYEAESPDESALVVAAKAFGFFFYKRTNTCVHVRERTARGVQDVEYEVLNVLEFNSTRKRMSVVVRDPHTGKLLLFTKGADTVIYERLDPSYKPNEAMKEVTTRHMEEFGSAGLRTLCLSYAYIDEEWYGREWAPKWTAAKVSLQNRDAKVAEVSELIERNLRLLGCTAIEDKLQEGVPQCIKQLAMAGIRIWVLTGDKMETAINIGFACSLLTEDMHQYTVSASSKRVGELEAAGKQDEADRMAADLVREQLEKIDAALTASGTTGDEPQGSGHEAALIIDGRALTFALAEQLAPVLLRVGLRCKAVVCCRVSPLQKAQVTTLVRSHGRITLAIGDGANDVGMIQRAHIGVGISGQEGMQAVMSADFAIAQFRFLTPLLLVHGYYSYKRISRMINFFFYKNLLFAITLFTYSAFTTFSGSYVYNDTSMTLFNVVFTSATPLVIGMFDRPVDKALLQRYPQLYQQGIRNTDFNARTIAGWFLSAVLQSAVLMVLALVGAAGVPAARGDGQPQGMAQVGVVLFTCVVLTVHLQLAVLEEAWTWVHHLAVWGSTALWWLYLIAFGYFPVSVSLEMWHLFEGVVAATPQYWLYILLVPLAAILPDVAYRVFKRLVAPSDDDIVREIGKREERERRQRGEGDQGPGESPGSGPAADGGVQKAAAERAGPGTAWGSVKGVGEVQVKRPASLMGSNKVAPEPVEQVKGFVQMAQEQLGVGANGRVGGGAGATMTPAAAAATALTSDALLAALPPSGFAAAAGSRAGSSSTWFAPRSRGGSSELGRSTANGAAGSRELPEGRPSGRGTQEGQQGEEGPPGRISSADGRGGSTRGSYSGQGRGQGSSLREPARVRGSGSGGVTPSHSTPTMVSAGGQGQSAPGELQEGVQTHSGASSPRRTQQQQQQRGTAGSIGSRHGTGRTTAPGSLSGQPTASVAGGRAVITPVVATRAMNEGEVQVGVLDGDGGFGPGGGVRAECGLSPRTSNSGSQALVGESGAAREEGGVVGGVGDVGTTVQALHRARDGRYTESGPQLEGVLSELWRSEGEGAGGVGVPRDRA